MNSEMLMKLGLAAGVLYLGFRFAPNQAIKAMVLGAAGAIVAKQVPYVRDVA